MVLGIQLAGIFLAHPGDLFPKSRKACGGEVSPARERRRTVENRGASRVAASLVCCPAFYASANLTPLRERPAGDAEGFERHTLLDKALRIYAWFLLIVTALPAAARLAKPRELARITLLRYQNLQRRKRARIGGLIYLGLSLFAIPFLLRAEMRQKRWLVMAVIVGMVSALEFLLNSRLFSEDALARQNRLFGAVFASMAIAVALLLFTR